MSIDEGSGNSRRLELTSYRLALTAMSIAYFYFGYLAPSPSFGFNQLTHLGSPWLGAMATSLPLAVLILPDRPWGRISRALIRITVPLERLAGSTPGATLVSIAAFSTFFLLRNGFINGDGVNFATCGFHENGGCIGFDEMLTSILT